MQVFESGLPCSLVSISLSANGRYIAVSDDTLMPEVWDRGTGRIVKLPCNREFGRGQLHPSGEFFLHFYRGLLSIVDLKTRRRSHCVEGEWRSPEFWFAGESMLVVWDAIPGSGYVFVGYTITPDRQLVRVWETPAGTRPLGPSTVFCPPSGDCFAHQTPLPGEWSPRGGPVQVWSATNGVILSSSTLDRSHELRGLLNPNTLLIAERDRLIAWDTTTGATRAVQLPGRNGKDTIHVASSSDRRKLVAARRQTVYEIDAQTFEIRRTLAFPINALIHSIAYSLDGLTAAFGTGKRQFVIWDLE